MGKMSRRAFLSAAASGTSAFLCGPLPMTRAFARSETWAQPAPKYLVPTIDAAFGTKITMITSPYSKIPGLELTWGRVATHHYSIDQAWSADQTLLVLDRGTTPRLFLDGRTYRPLMARREPGEVRWHPRRANQMIFVSGRGIGLWDVLKDQTLLLSALPGYGELEFGRHKGNPSDDGSMIAITARRSDGRRVVFAYNLETGQKHADIDMSGEYKVGHTTVSPTGSFIIAYSWTTSESSSRRRRVFTTDGELLQTWTEYERPGHGDFTVDNAGDEVFVGRSKSAPERWRIIKRRLTDGKVTVLSRPCFASHVSARNLNDPGWIFATFTDRHDRRGFAPYRGEVTAISMDGTERARRLVKTHAVANGYLTEPHASPAPDGMRAIFASNWGDKDGPVAAYVAEFQHATVRDS
jgi:hypothetical protein